MHSGREVPGPALALASSVITGVITIPRPRGYKGKIFLIKLRKVTPRFRIRVLAALVNI